MEVPVLWDEVLDFFSSRRYSKIEAFIRKETDAGKSILPGEANVFNALRLTPPDAVKVVILGQDPYPNKHHAHGLAFSIPRGETDVPKSLKNILMELESDIGIIASSGNLEPWARQGVLLLNRILTVEEGIPNSHRKIGWQDLTAEIIQHVNKNRENVVFMLWGNPAQECKKFISEGKHHVIESPHPSPLAAYRGFFGSKPFSKTNKFLECKGLTGIDWSL
nr:uracil-DNA glycosylase [Candidatus Sigynarchaeota archaeon]